LCHRNCAPLTERGKRQTKLGSHQTLRNSANFTRTSETVPPGDVSTILAGYFGTKKVQFSVDSLVTHTTHTYDSTNDLMQEVEAARIYAGFHYHHSVVEGRELGRKVARQLMKEFFRPSNEDREVNVEGGSDTNREQRN
jgi:hypothetical protein